MEEDYSPLIDSDKSKPSDKLNKYHLLCIVILVSSIPMQAKIEHLFDIFDFNDKGYLLKEELLLVIKSVISSAAIVDPTLMQAPPSNNFYKVFIKYATRYTISSSIIANKLSDRVSRRELVSVCSETKYIRDFLNSFHGLVKQINITDHVWIDDMFPPVYYSLYPSRDIGRSLLLPSDEYITWTRRNRHQSKLFAHSTSISKNIRYKYQYHGSGVLGEDRISQQRNILADRWLQTAINIVASKPQMFMKLFPVTDQEVNGRYSFQIFEGTCWRIIYVDDNFPCSIDGRNLFMTSTDPNEICLEIAEKAIAKYFGSYSQIALCSNRLDAICMGLRSLTGGHIYQRPLKEFVWTSSFIHKEDNNGFEYVDNEFEEGSFISFGRSKDLQPVDHRDDKDHDQIMMRQYPVGIMYPVVDVCVINDIKYFILKDVYDQDTARGHERVSAGPTDIKNNNVDDEAVTRIKTKQSDDKLLSLYDGGLCHTFAICVDELMKYFDTMILSKCPDIYRRHYSSSNVLNCSISSTKRRPIQPPGWNTICLENISHGPSNPAIFVLKVGDKNLLSKYFDDGTDAREEYTEALDEYLHGGGFTHPMCQKSPCELLDFYEVSMTVSSAIPWVFSGRPSLEPITRFCVIPSFKTREILSSDRYKSYQNQPKGVRIDESTSFEICSDGNASWLSRSFYLRPGIYYVFADVSFNTEYCVIEKISTPHDSVSESFPWIRQTCNRDTTVDQQIGSSQSQLVLQLSCNTSFSLKTISSQDVPENNVDLSLLNDNTTSSTFFCESQSEVISQGLIDFLQSLQRDYEMSSKKYNDLNERFQALLSDVESYHNAVDSDIEANDSNDRTAFLADDSQPSQKDTSASTDHPIVADNTRKRNSAFSFASPTFKE